MNTTKLKLITIALLLLTLRAGCTNEDCGDVGNSNPDDVQRLLTTKKCIGCQIGKTDISGANLAGADLRGANLIGTKLGKANLRGANLANAKTGRESADNYSSEHEINCFNLYFTELESVDLTQANLSGARFETVQLEGAKLYQANLSYATIRGSLEYADLRQANLSHAHITGGLEHADLRGAKNSQNLDMTSAGLFFANLSGLDLRGARLFNATLNGAKLISTNLERADLKLASLYNTDLQKANLNKADLRGADLQGTNLEEATLKGAIYGKFSHPDYDHGSHLISTDNTKFPEDFDPIKAGMIKAKDPE